MLHPSWKLVRSVFGVLVFGALSFGATQVFATTRWGYAPPGQGCFQYCTDTYGEGTQPVWDYYNGYQWHCGCIL